MKRLLTLTAVLCAVACVLTPGASAHALTWREHTVHSGALVTPVPVSQLSCPTASECVGVDSLGSVAWSTNVGQTGTDWTVTGDLSPGHIFVSLSCPSTTLCVAITAAKGDGEHFHIAVSTDPTGPATGWADTAFPTRTGSEMDNVDCPTTQLCVIDGGEGLLISTDPTGGVTTWKPVLGTVLHASGGELFDWVSCTSDSLCVTAGDLGGIYSSTDPTGGNAAWHRVADFPKLGFNYVDCPTTSLCVALDYQGRVVTSADPTAADPTWTDEGAIPDLREFTTGLTCTAAGLCVATDGRGDVAASVDPTGVAPASWQGTKRVDPRGLTSPVCVSADLCMAAGGVGGIAQSASPDAASPDWTVSATSPGPDLVSSQPFTGISCPSVSLCAATAGGGHIATIEDPLHSHAWHAVAADPTANLSAISCPSASFCAAAGASDALATTTDPTGAASAWTATTLDLSWTSSQASGRDGFDAISCPSVSECVAPDAYASDIPSSLNPAGGASAWRADYGGRYYDQFLAVSCPSVAECVAVGLTGEVWTQQTHGRPHQLISHGVDLNSISCPTVSFCVATGAANSNSGAASDVFVGSPVGDTDWTASRIETSAADALNAVACASTHLCVAVDSGGRVFVSTDPAAGGRSWVRTVVAPGEALTAVDCPSTTMCVAVGNDGTEVLGS